MRVEAPIFQRLMAKYRGPDLTDEDWHLKSYMRGFLYGLVLQDALRIEPQPIRFPHHDLDTRIPCYLLPQVAPPKSVFVTGAGESLTP